MAARMRLRVSLIALTLPLLLWIVLPVGSDGASLQERIESKRSHVASK